MSLKAVSELDCGELLLFITFHIMIQDVTERLVAYYRYFASRKINDYEKISQMLMIRSTLMQIPKLLLHRIFPNVRYSIWIDGKLQLVVDPYQVLERYPTAHASVSLFHLLVVVDASSGFFGTTEVKKLIF